MLAAMVSSSTRFTHDILLEIFTRLPLNAIYKFKCLSKVWLSNLSDTNFTIKWFRTNKKSLPWIQYHSMTQLGSDDSPLRFRNVYHDSHSDFMSRNQHLFSFKFLINHKSFQGDRLFLLASSNGLVLCWTTNPSNRRSGYHVCNPLTMTWVSLPEPPDYEGGPFDINGIVCEYSSSFVSNYKVVRIGNLFTPSKKFNLEMFSSDLGVWQSFEVFCDKAVMWTFHRYDYPVILNGVMFWFEEGRNNLLGYSLNQKNGSDGHRCSFINLPDEEFGDHDTDFDNTIGESEGWVCYARIRTISRELTVSVWVLGEFNWQLLHRDISIDGVLAKLCAKTGNQQGQDIQVLGFSPVDRNVVLLGWKHWIWGFNIETKSIEEHCLDNRHVRDIGVMIWPFSLKPMPTVLPLPSWIDT